VTAILVALLLAQAPTPPADVEASDGFYCATTRHFAYETLLHDSKAAHLLHIVSLEAEPVGRPEIQIPIPAAFATGISCSTNTVRVRTADASTTVRLDLKTWRAQVAPGSDEVAAWRSTRLWGTGSPATSAQRRIALARFGRGGGIHLQMLRLSEGGANCLTAAGALLVRLDARGREVHSRGIFLRQFSCRRAGVVGPPQADECSPQPGRVLRRFSGRAAAGKTYAHPIAPFRFALAADGQYGWTIDVFPARGDRDLTSLLPLHGMSGRDVIPPRPSALSTPFWRTFPFHFHPEARRTIVYVDDTITMLVNDLKVRSYGRGRLTIDEYSLGSAGNDKEKFEWIEFSVCVSWPR